MRKILLTAFLSQILVTGFAQVDSSNKENFRAYLVKQTQPGGKFDYFTPIKGHEYDAVEIEPRLFTTQISLALRQWGRMAKLVGVKTLEEAYDIFTDFKKRKPNEPEREYIKWGFTDKLPTD